MNAKGVKQMRRRLIGYGLTCMLLTGLWAVSAAPPAGFSGTWVLDKAKSESLPPRWDDIVSLTMIVTQTDQQLSLENKVVRGDQPAGGGGQGAPGGGGPGGGGGRRGGFGMPLPSATFKLDGTETKVETSGERPSTNTHKAVWKNEGKVLELTTIRKFNVEGNDVTATLKEIWELSEDGKTLKVQRTSESPRGTQESKLTFNKQ